MKTYTKIADKVWKVLAYILALMLAVLVLIVFWQIICRYVLKKANGWTQEVSTLVFVWTTFLGAALAIRNGAQITMKVFVNKMPLITGKILTLLAALVCEAFYVVLSVAGISAMQVFADTTTSALRLPMTIPYGAITLCGVVMLFFGVDEIAKPIVDMMKQVKGGNK